MAPPPISKTYRTVTPLCRIEPNREFLWTVTPLINIYIYIWWALSSSTVFMCTSIRRIDLHISLTGFSVVDFCCGWMTLHLSESFSWNLMCAFCNIEVIKATHCSYTWKLLLVWCKHHILFHIQHKMLRFAKPSCVFLSPTGRDERYLNEIWVIVTFVWF